MFLLSVPRPCGDGFKPAYICVLVLHLMLSNHQRATRFLFALNVLAFAAAARSLCRFFPPTMGGSRLSLEARLRAKVHRSTSLLLLNDG